MRRLFLVVLGLFLVLVPTACRVNADVLVDVSADGSGVVTVTVVLDGDAAAKLGDPATAIRVDDLSAAGWRLGKPVIDKKSGDVTYRAARDFASPAELATVLTEIGGGSKDSPGVFSGVKLQIDNGFASTNYAFQTDVSLTGSLEQFSDPELTKALGGLPLGRTPQELVAEGASKDSVVLTVTVNLPGGSPESNGEVADSRARWTLHPDSGKATDTPLRVSSTDSTSTVWVLIGAGVVLVALAAGLVGLAFRRIRH